MNGWIKLPRTIIERPWFRDRNDNTLRLYLYLAVSAYTQDAVYQGITIRRGSCPCTRATLQEATGLSYQQIDTCLRRLQRFGDIILKANNRFTIAILRNYDAVEQEELLFSNQANSQQTASKQPVIQPADNTPINNKNIEYRNKNNLISLKKSYKKERESVAYEIKKRYNEHFKATLPPLLRLSTLARLSCEECIRQFGLQSVDIVFEQISHEPFALGKNRTGFIADFSFIFNPANYQKYLERATLRREKKTSPPSTPAEPDPPEPTPEEKAEQRRQELLAMIDTWKQNPQASCRYTVIGAFNSGELQRLNIPIPSQLSQQPPINPSTPQ